MTRDDVDRLFELLSIYVAKDSRAHNNKLKSAWALVLEPYDPADVKKAVAQHFRKHNYWPDVTELAKLCPDPKPEEKPTTKYGKPDAEFTAKVKKAQRIFEDREKAGLPWSCAAAVELGVGLGEYMAKVEALGLMLPLL